MCFEEGEYKYMKNEFVTFCKYGCGNGVVLKFDNEDEKLSLQLVSDNFYLMHNMGGMSPIEKLKRIWCILIGKEYSYFDILFDKCELKEFKEFVSKL